MAEQNNQNNNEENKEKDKEKDLENVSSNLHDSSWLKDSVKTDKVKERELHTRICARCKQPYQTKIGVDNWKNLFRTPTLDEWITLIILILLIAAAFAYTTETKSCKETLNNLDEICLKRGNSLINNTGNGLPAYNFYILNESTLEVNSSNDSSSNLNGYTNNTEDINYSSNSTQDKNISK
jgi:hypothetical protein